MSGIHCWEYASDEQRTEGSKEEEAALLFPAAANFPKKRKTGDKYPGCYRWTGPETLWLAAPDDLLPKR